MMPPETVPATFMWLPTQTSANEGAESAESVKVVAEVTSTLVMPRAESSPSVSEPVAPAFAQVPVPVVPSMELTVPFTVAGVGGSTETFMFQTERGAAKANPGVAPWLLADDDTAGVAPAAVADNPRTAITAIGIARPRCSLAGLLNICDFLLLGTSRHLADLPRGPQTDFQERRTALAT